MEKTDGAIQNEFKTLTDHLNDKTHNRKEKMLSADQIKDNKEKIIRMLRSTGREGMEKVIDYLEKNDFFNIPSSLYRHHNWEGGLAQHCIGVYKRLKATGHELPEDSVILTSCLHDICKTGKFYKDLNGVWKEKEQTFQGHGKRSVNILKDLGLSLSPEEIRAIRWHMGGWKINERPKEEIRDFFATKKSDLWRLLHNADRYDASHNAESKK